MPPLTVRWLLRSAAALAGAACGVVLLSAGAQAASCGNAGLALPPGFCATLFADKLGHVRQMTVAPDGVLYVNTWSGAYYNNGAVPAGGFLIALRDKNGDGRADEVQRFGPSSASGGRGGTGIAYYDGAIYAESGNSILRYRLGEGGIVPQDQGETILSGLPLTGDHPMHPFMITPQGMLLVDVASATNACERQNRFPHSPGREPCTEKRTRGGVWRYDASKTGQTFSAAGRYAAGLRNAEGISIDAQGRIFATQHGRDQLHEDWPELYSASAGQEEPAEELVLLRQGADYGWPECYFDTRAKRLVLGPEYGGDGGRKVGPCAARQGPVAYFPAHWAPNDMKIYIASAFPKAYRGGAFIAFHGSWNRAPGAQGGYNVVFQPLADGKAAGPYVVFADGFAGADKEPGRAAYRPTGLAVARDGALFISDDVQGRIWRVTYQGGNADAPVAAASSPGAASPSTASAVVPPPEGIHPNAGAEANLPVPPGFTQAQLARGDRIFHGRAAGGTCSSCHGADGKGTATGSDLARGKWLWSDGSVDGIAAVIARGVPKPRQHTGAMPPLGGAQLSAADVKAVAAYVWALGHAQP